MESVITTESFKNDDSSVPKILVSVFACSPEWGSEVGTGWSWVLALSKYFPLHVITESGFEKGIMAHIELFNDRNVPVFHFVDIGIKGRNLFWDQGNWGFYYYYKKWQKKAFQLACSLHKEESFDIIHQLGMIGFREPGYLWSVRGKKHLFIWGPVGGMGDLPWRFLPELGWHSMCVYSLKNVINRLQLRLNLRVKKAINRSDLLFAATKENQKEIKRVFGRDAILLNETGAKIDELNSKREDSAFRIVWCGVMESRKALNILLDALRILKDQNIMPEVDIIGDGQSKQKWEEYAKKIGVYDNCTWYGRIDNKKAIELIKRSSVMVLSSIREGTPHVLLEALENGIPVIAHDTCGMSSVLTPASGILVPMLSPKKSSRLFAEAIKRTMNDNSFLKELSCGAFARAKELSWDNKALFMKKQYESLLANRG